MKFSPPHLLLLVIVALFAFPSLTNADDAGYECPPDLCGSSSGADVSVPEEPTADVTGDGEADMTLAEPASESNYSSADLDQDGDKTTVPSDAEGISSISEQERYEQFLTCGDRSDCNEGQGLLSGVSSDDASGVARYMGMFGFSSSALTRVVATEAVADAAGAGAGALGAGTAEIGGGAALCSTGVGCAVVGAGALLIGGYVAYEIYSADSEQQTPKFVPLDDRDVDLKQMTIAPEDKTPKAVTLDDRDADLRQMTVVEPKLEMPKRPGERKSNEPVKLPKTPTDGSVPAPTQMAASDANPPKGDTQASTGGSKKAELRKAFKAREEEENKAAKAVAQVMGMALPSPDDPEGDLRPDLSPGKGQDRPTPPAPTKVPENASSKQTSADAAEDVGDPAGSTSDTAQSEAEGSLDTSSSAVDDSSSTAEPGEASTGDDAPEERDEDPPVGLAKDGALSPDLAITDQDAELDFLDGVDRPTIVPIKPTSPLAVVGEALDIAVHVPAVIAKGMWFLSGKLSFEAEKAVDKGVVQPVKVTAVEVLDTAADVAKISGNVISAGITAGLSVVTLPFEMANRAVQYSNKGKYDPNAPDAPEALEDPKTDN